MSDSRSKRVKQSCCFRFPGSSLSRFPFPASPTLSDPFGPDPQSAGLVFPAVGPFRRVRH
ncbi:hypothetical protein F5983_29715 [Streptomyces arboris]|uniref:Uncharacterized protein n=1 Tax=Streptomyces arboris TaxID=2600619 RepID=A0A5N5EDT4_9ACTN|nr:hypothetical protein F5983_29715 [Streptomyces arboris]